MKAQQSTYIFDPPGNLTAVIGTNVVAPIITGQPQSALLYSNNVISFSVASTGAGISYQWLSNGIPIIGATNDTLIFPSLTSTNGNFSVIISNSSGSVTSTPAAIWLDSRGVGMPDWWQLKYFGNLTQSPYGDYDGDGVDNLDEYREGTLPNNSSSYYPRLYLQKPNNGRVVASPDQPYYTNGQVVTLTAIPDTGQSFLGWSGAATGTNILITLAMTSHKTVVASFGISLPVALDNTNLIWTTGGSAPWYGQTAVTEDGTNAAQSGLITDSQQSWLQGVNNVSQPVQMGFWWNVSSQPPDALSFSVDGHALGSISGESIGWQFMLADLMSGTHTNLWTFSKNSTDNATGIPFADSAWVDKVFFIPYGTNYGPNCVSPPSGLVAYWPGQNNAFDVAGTNNGTLVGGVNYSAGEVGAAFNFGGVNGYVSVPSSPALNLTNALTIEAWIKLNNLNTYYFIATKQPSGTAGNNIGGNFEFAIQPTGYMELLHQTSAGRTFSSYVATSGVSTGVLHHVAVTLESGGNVNFYLDGAAAGTFPQQGTFGITNSQPVRIGTRADAYSYFNGLIDELSIYNRALTSNEINSIYLAGSDGKCMPPTAPSITAQPQGVTNFFGTSAQFNVAAFGSPPLSYQWRLNSNSIPTATNSLLMLTNVSHTNAGVYAVLVTNLYGSMLSSNATLAVQVPQQLSGAKLTGGVFKLTAGYADGWPVGSGELTNFAAQVSSNLVSWITLSNSLTLSNGFLLFQDSSVTNQPTRFYRIIQH